jgi:hypothetical protein
MSADPAPTAPPPVRPTFRFPHGWAALVLIPAAVFAVHGRALEHGLFIDDWHHAEQFGRIGWSPRDLFTGLVFDYTDDIFRLWWAERPVVVKYCRPFSVALHKLIFTVWGLDPVANHLANLIAHLAASWLVCLTAAEWFGRRDIALVAGLVFAVHPAGTVAAQFCGTLAEPVSAAWAMLSMWLMLRAVGTAGPAATAYWAGSYAACGLAVLSRENVIVLPFALALAGLWGMPRREGTSRPSVWRFAPYFAVAAGYFALRTALLGGFPTPPPPYYTGPADPGFAFQAGCKFLCNTSGLVLCIPWLPMLSESLLAEHWWLWAAVAAPMIAVALRMRPRLTEVPGTLFWALWIGVFSAATLPMFVSPHYLYLPMAGWAMLAAAGAMRAIERRPDLSGRVLRRLALGGLLALYAAGSVFGLLVLRGGFRPGILSLQDAVGRRPDYPPDARLFLINLNPLAHQVIPGTRLELGRPDLQGWVLTFAPDVLGPRGDLRLRRIDDHTLEVASGGEAYFSGRLGRVLMQATDRRPFAAGEEIVPDPARFPFRVTVVEGGPEGVRTFRFRFEKPLDSPEYVFLMGTERRFLAPVEIADVPGPGEQ